MQIQQDFAFNLQMNMITHGLWDMDGKPLLQGKLQTFNIIGYIDSSCRPEKRSRGAEEKR